MFAGRIELMDVENTIEFILEQQAQVAAIQTKHEADIARLDAHLRRAIRLTVQEARKERRLRREWDAELQRRIALNEEMNDRLGGKIDRLSDKIDRLVDAGLRGNGH